MPPLTEAETCDRFITPAIVQAGWATAQIRREYTFTRGAVRVRGKLAVRGERKRADYLLFDAPNAPLAVIEAKEYSQDVGAGMAQALAYAEALDVPFALSSNGQGFILHDRTGQSDPVEQHLALHELPSPEALWARHRAARGLSPEAERLAAFPFHEDGSGREPRYDQRVAIQRTVEAVARGQGRILHIMATGTGKAYTAFQITGDCGRAVPPAASSFWPIATCSSTRPNEKISALSAPP